MDLLDGRFLLVVAFEFICLVWPSLLVSTILIIM